MKTTKNRVSNDPIGDFLTRIRNAIAVHKKTVIIPHSKVKEQLAALLKKEGYIIDYTVINEEDAPTKGIEIQIKYNAAGNPVIRGIRRVSNPGLRKYTKAKYAPRVLNGLGISVLTTNKGLKTDRAARKDGVGGELLCQVW
jgi:small subunit ribosomal protein S8